MTADEFERGREKVRCRWCGRSWEEIDAKERQEDGGCGGVRLVYALAVLFGLLEVPQPIGVYFKGAVVSPEATEENCLRLEKVWIMVY